MITVKINNLEFTVKEGISILEACRTVGLHIPRFCYHDSLSIAGNCRMCLVKLEDIDALIISCLTEITENMEVITEDPFVQKAREDIIDFLLLDHPLDCPICDQGGECDLQDQAKKYGNISSKYFLNKATTEDKNFNFFIKTIMTRCIHCTRCVRFSSEVAGVDSIGTLNRGNNTEIGLYSNKFFESEISGNVIDLCPVGALTSKPYAFKSRPWELKLAESLDFTDSLGSNVYLNYNNNKVLRIIPKFNSEINGSVISDKARFYYDAMDASNLLKKTLSFKDYKNEKVQNSNNLNNIILSQINNEKCLILVNQSLNLELVQLLKKISNKYKNITVRSVDINYLKNNLYFENNITISSIESGKNICFLIATNPRTENALINNKIRFLNFNKFIKIYSVGYSYESNLKLKILNFNVNKLGLLLKGKVKNISLQIIKSFNPLIFVGNSAFERGLNFSFLKKTFEFLNPSSIIVNLHLNVNTVGFNYFNIKNLTGYDIKNNKNLFFFNCDNTTFLQKILLKTNKTSNFLWFSPYLIPFNINNGYQIPTNTFFEENGTFLNLESRPQKYYKIFQPNSNKTILFNYLKFLFRFSNKKNKNVFYIKELLDKQDQFVKSKNVIYSEFLKMIFFSKIKHLQIKNYPFKTKTNNIYQSNELTRNSKNLLQASQLYEKNAHNFY